MSYDEEGVIFYDKNDKRNVYTGEILKGVPHGKGRLEYKDGKVEEGHFDNGVFKKDSEKEKTDKKDDKPDQKDEKSEEPKSSNLLRNIALGTAGLGVAGVAYYMMKKKRKSISSSGSSNRRRSARRSKRNRKSSSRFR